MIHYPDARRPTNKLQLPNIGRESSGRHQEKWDRGQKGRGASASGDCQTKVRDLQLFIHIYLFMATFNLLLL